MSSKAMVLVQLLDRIPNADELQRLLEPDTLLYVMQQYGYEKEALQQRLDQGTLREELLLELLHKESSIHKLFVLLSDKMDTRVEKRVDLEEIIRQGRLKKANDLSFRTTPKVTPIVSIPPPTPDMTPKSTTPVPESSPEVTVAVEVEVIEPPVMIPNKKNSLIENHGLSIAVIIVTLTSIIPAMILANSVSNTTLIPFLAVGLLVAVIGGALAGTIFARTMEIVRARGIFLGVVLNVGVLGTVLPYCLENASFSSFNLLLPAVIGSIPAIILYFVLKRRAS